MPDFGEPLMVKYLHDKGAREGIPVSGTFELTQRCNFSCEMCYVHDCKQNIAPLSAEDWLDLAQQAKDAGTVFLLLTGGEPLLRDDFEYIYRSLARMGFLVSINTNGSLLEKYTELFKELPPTRINVSLYGADNSTYSKICGNGAFDKVLNSVKKMKELGISVKFNTMFTPENISDYKKIADISKELLIPIKPTTYVYPPARLGKNNDNRFSPEEAAEYINLIDEYRFDKEFYAERLKRLLALPKGPEENKVRCRAGRASFWITADGIMRPCGMMPEPDAKPLVDGFDKAWNEIKTKTEQIRLPEECLTCKYAGVCSVCAAMCKAETGDFGKTPKYICRMTKRIFELAERSVRGIESK
ncbi:MAG: radical SAM protein [Clostridia bacterium]|nr:radical SAM protein [Clostridia bacterium]